MGSEVEGVASLLLSVAFGFFEIPRCCGIRQDPCEEIPHRQICHDGVVVMSSTGSWLRERREELHLTRSGVERLTSDSANKSTNERYRIRRGRLTDIEQDKSPPDIFEVASLSECYKLTYPAVLRAFGLQLGGTDDVAEDSSLPDASIEHRSLAGTDRPFSATFQSTASFDSTRLVTESAEELGVPAAVRRRLEFGHLRLGIIGASDDTMGELVPGGSVVVIDNSDTGIEVGGWASIRERPIYFVWHDKGYSCSWCHLVRDTLFIVPYPTSRQPVMMFKIPRAATVIGRIVHVWAPLVAAKKYT